MSFEETYDEMLRAEFGSGGRGTQAAEQDAGPASHGEDDASPAHLAAADAPVHAADAPIHEAFQTAAAPAAVEGAPAGGEGPRGLARYRNAAMVGAGGLACAALGAFLGGLGGSFTVNPAAAHPLASSTTPDQTLAAAADQAHGGEAAAPGWGALGSASLTSLSGSLTQGIAPLQWLVSSSGSGAGGPSTVTLADLPGGATSGLGSGTGLGSGCSPTESELGLSCLLDTVTVALGNLGTATGDPTGQLDGLVLPVGGIPASGLPGLGSPGTGLSGTGGATSALTSVLDGLTAAAASATGSSGSTSPSLPLSAGGGSVPGVDGVPVTVPSATTTTLPASSGSGASSSGGTATTVTVPLPALPVPIGTPPVSVGGVSVGVSSSGSGSGLTLSLP